MTEKEFDLKDNFKRRYAGLVRIKSYIRKWKNSNELKFSTKEIQMFDRMFISIDKKLSMLESDYLFLFKNGDIEDLRKYLKNDNGNKNK